MKRTLLAAWAVAAATSLFAQNYQVVVTSTDGERKVFATNDVASIKFKDAPVYKEANTFISGLYSPYAENALYDITIGTEEPDEEGEPATVGGFQIGLSMYAPLSDEAQNAILPEGYYRVGSGTSSYTISATNSAMWIRFAAGTDGTTVSMIVDGTVDVKHDGQNYDMRIELDLLDGSHVDASYYGPMTFKVGASGSTDFEDDQNVSFTEGQGRVWANWFNPFSDDAALQFFTGKFTSSGTQTEGYYLYLPVFMNKDESRDATWTPVIPDGTYKIDPRDFVSGQTYLPNTLQKGANLEIFGSTTATGSYMTYLAADGRLQMALITDGEMTVSENGTKFLFDFTAKNGIKISGSYNNKPYIVNMIDNSSKPEFPDELTADYELKKFPDNAVAIDYKMGDYIVSGLNSHILMFTDPDMKKGDYLELDLFSDSEELKDGVYTVDNSLKDMSGIKGSVNYQGNIVYSWYGDLDSTDDEGYQSILAPVSGGTLTVSTVDGGMKKFDFDLLDLKGNRITGTLTKTLNYFSDSDINEAKIERNRSRIGKVKRNWGKRDMNLSRSLMIRK
ncbi:MAG TPA: hypothetical protein DEQ27_04985 [Prevotella sp.]|nr:hypothetical protein [Prevotella sp.]